MSDILKLRKKKPYLNMVTGPTNDACPVIK